MRVLITGLPGAGKTTLAKALLAAMPEAVHFEAEVVRALYRDQDFSEEGRARQAARMRALANEVAAGRVALCDFICPNDLTREIFNPAFTIWVDGGPPGDARIMEVWEQPVNADWYIDWSWGPEFVQMLVAEIRGRMAEIPDIHKATVEGCDHDEWDEVEFTLPVLQQDPVSGGPLALRVLETRKYKRKICKHCVKAVYIDLGPV